MLDLKFVREHPTDVARALETRGGGEPVEKLLALDADRRRRVSAVETQKQARNTATEEISRAKRRGENPAEEMARMRKLSEEIKEHDTKIREIEQEMEALLLQLPNLPHPSVPVGAGEEENVEVRRWGTPRHFAFAPRPHDELGEALGLLDFERASRLAKSRFTVLWGPAARLGRALIQFMLDLHTREHGYTELWVPHLVNAETMTGTGQLPKFEDDLFKTIEPEHKRVLYLIPTAEVPLTALHAGEFLPEETLPRRYVAYTPCYRSEAGSYGKDTKGMIRQHQFDKVELVKITTPTQSYDELESMVLNAEEVLRRLEIPYRVVLHCTADMGFAAAKSYDIEVWLPGQGRYREISSCSNCEAFQARRLNLRYRPAGGGKADHCHTLNGSGVAVGRTLIAVLENLQEGDGSVTIPAALRPYMGGLERIAARDA